LKYLSTQKPADITQMKLSVSLN